MTPEPTSAASPPLAYLRLRRSISRGRPSCLTAGKVTVGFSLGFIQSKEMPNVAFFVCQNRAQDYFWKPEYQSHANGATGIAAVYLSSPAPERDAAFVNKMFGGEVSSVVGGFKVMCGPSQELRVLTPQAIGERDRSLEWPAMSTPILASIALATDSNQRRTSRCQRKGDVRRVGNGVARVPARVFPATHL